jgi:hypothetical protein
LLQAEQKMRRRLDGCPIVSCSPCLRYVAVIELS